MHKLKLIGIPHDSNSSFLKGAALGPSSIRLMEKEGSANCFSEMGKELIDGINYQDCGDIVLSTVDSDFVNQNSDAKYVEKYIGFNASWVVFWILWC